MREQVQSAGAPSQLRIRSRGDESCVLCCPSLTDMRAVQITRFGGPEVMDVVDLPDPVPGDGEDLYDVSAAGINHADTHHSLS
jgi:hypothetical protein